MAVAAKASQARISSKKLKSVADAVKGKKVGDALNLLRFLTTPAAAAIAKVVKSAAANAENNLLLDREDLRIVEIYANEGPRIKRIRPRARGRAGRITRRTSHITVVVEEEGS
ncbi:MAG: 50S ribosomal protein L22 [Chloroflexi bacterium]|nr:50S ribosomal protein L22 [Chloroflexota bacterium]